MIGLIKLTMPHGEPVYIHPGMITFFAPNSKDSAVALSINNAMVNERGSLLFIGGLCMQVQENPNQIINSITRLRQRAEDNALNLRKRADKEDWEDWEDEDE